MHILEPLRYIGFLWKKVSPILLVANSAANNRCVGSVWTVKWSVCIVHVLVSVTAHPAEGR